MFAYCGNNPIAATDISGKRPVWKRQYGGGCVEYTDSCTGRPIKDITNDLNEVMEAHAVELKTYCMEKTEAHNTAYWLTGGMPFTLNNAGAVAYNESLWYFESKETNGGEWDLKETEAFWKFDHFLYNGRVVTGEDVGNIHFGYVGTALFSKEVLFAGAGLNQAIRSFHIEYAPYWFDEPRDYEMTSYGIALYQEAHP